MGRVKLFALWTVVLIGVCFSGCSLAYAEVPAITGSQQMQVNASQILTATGGCGDYAWTLVSGDGNLSSSGNSATYTAPPSNPYCTGNPTIRVTDGCGMSVELRIAVNGYLTSAIAYRVKL